MDYLTTEEVAEFKCCSLQNIQKLLKDGKIESKQELNHKGRMKYLIPVSALPKDLQTKYYRQKRTEAAARFPDPYGIAFCLNSVKMLMR